MDATPDALPIATGALFWQARHLRASPFLGHLPLAFWLMDVLRPSSTVVLGVGDGASFLAFCQAIDVLGLSARCHGVTPSHPEDLRPETIAVDELLPYRSVARLVTRSPIEAAAEFTDGSVDLLHLDPSLGSSAMRAIETRWGPKLSRRAVVLVSGDAEAAPFVRKPSFRFEHAGGITLALPGEEPPEPLRRLCGLRLGTPAHATARRAFERLGRTHQLEWNARERASAPTGSERDADVRAAHLPSEAARQEGARQEGAFAGARGSLEMATPHARHFARGVEVRTPAPDEAGCEAIHQRDLALAVRAAEIERHQDCIADLEARLAARSDEIAALVGLMELRDRKALDRRRSEQEQAQETTARLDAALEQARCEHERRAVQDAQRTKELEAANARLTRELKAVEASRDEILRSRVWRATASPRRLLEALRRGLAPSAGTVGRERRG